MLLQESYLSAGTFRRANAVLCSIRAPSFDNLFALARAAIAFCVCIQADTMTARGRHSMQGMSRRARTVPSLNLFFV